MLVHHILRDNSDIFVDIKNRDDLYLLREKFLESQHLSSQEVKYIKWLLPNTLEYTSNFMKLGQKFLEIIGFFRIKVTEVGF